MTPKEEPEKKSPEDPQTLRRPKDCVIFEAHYEQASDTVR